MGEASLVEQWPASVRSKRLPHFSRFSRSGAFLLTIQLWTLYFPPRYGPPPGLHLPSAPLSSRPDCFGTGIGTLRLRACVSDQVALSVEGRNEHRTIVMIATWLVSRKQRRFPPLRCHVSQPFTEATVAKLSGTPEELNGIIGAKRRNAGLHCAVVLITKR
jgi:hypothetical protein